MRQSQPLRSVSLCHMYVSSAPNTWSTTQPQSRSDHVPGNTTTPNFKFVPAPKARAGSPRNCRFRGVRIRPRRTSPSLVLRLEVEAEIFDHVVGEQLAAHRLHALAGLVLARSVEVDLDVLADADVGDLAKTERGKPLLDRDSLRVVDHRLWRDDDSGNHRSFLGLGGNSGLPTSL